MEQVRRLASELSSTDHDDRSIVQVVERTTGAAAALTDTPPGRSAPGYVEVAVDGGAGPPFTLTLDFPAAADVPSQPVLQAVSIAVGAARRQGRLAVDHAFQSWATGLRLELADELMRRHDCAGILKALSAVVVPALADDVALVPAGGGDEPASAGETDVSRHVLADGSALVFRRAGGWGRRDEELLGDLVAAVARARVEAEVSEAQRRTRGILERSLLPAALIPTPGLQLASRYLAATRGQEVGGDFYDAISGPDGVTLIVGDVQGKGIEAATLTSLARHTLRAAAFEGVAPAELLRRLNRALLYGQAEQRCAGGTPLPRFVTAAVANLTRSGDGFDAVLARAGHPPPLVVRPGGHVELLQPAGVLLGVAVDPAIEELEVHLARADTLVLYTDGVTEQRRSAHPFDEFELGRLVSHQLGAVDAEVLADAIQDTVLLVSPEDNRDDIAFLVACVRP
ncbi:MAG: PP2C family protein-serine/threonine phosphatase [Acidimicrobiia bacterium]